MAKPKRKKQPALKQSDAGQTLDRKADSPSEKQNTDEAGKSNAGTKQTRWRLIGIVLLVFVAAFVLIGRYSLATYCKSLARQRMSQYEFIAAVECLEFTEKWGVDDAQVHFLKARIFRKTGKFDKFEKSLAKAKSKGLDQSVINNEKLLLRGQSGKIGELLDKLEDLVGGEKQFDPPEVYESLVNGFLLNGRFVEATKYLDLWEKDYPKDPNQRYYRAGVMVRFQLMHQIQSPETVTMLEDLIEEYPKHFRAINAYARYLSSRNQFEKAANLLERCVALPDSGTESRIFLAQCYVNLGKQDKAKELFKEVLESDPNNGEVRGELGKLQFNDEEFDEAMTNLELAYRTRSFDPELISMLARLKRLYKNEGEANRLFARADDVREKLKEIQALYDQMDKSPDEEKRVRLGKLLLEYSDPSLGIRYLRSVLDVNPNHQGAKQALADYYAKQKQ